MAAPVEPSSDLEEAKSLYERGRAKFDTYDYSGAAELWTEAYGRLDDSPEHRVVRNDLVYNIATAQERAYELDGDLARLRQARALLAKFLENYEELVEDSPEKAAEIEKVQGRIQQLDQRIASGQPPADTASPPPAPALDPAQAEKLAIRQQRAQVRDLLQTDPELAPRYRKGRGMFAGGIAMIVAGGISTFGFVGLASEFRGPKIAGGVVGSLGVAVLGGGIALAVIGSKHKREAQAEAYERVSVLPTLGPTGGDLAVRVRF